MGSWRMPQRSSQTALLERDPFPTRMPARPARRAARDEDEVEVPAPERVARTLDDYRAAVAARFAEHRRVDVTGDFVVCTCGDRAPCRVERLAARLLDWM